jgi:hypothetical protein
MRTFTPSASDASTHGLAACLLGRGRTFQPELSKVRSLDNRRRAAYVLREAAGVWQARRQRGNPLSFSTRLPAPFRRPGSQTTEL